MEIQVQSAAMLKTVHVPQLLASVSLPTAKYVCAKCDWEYRECEGIHSFDFERVKDEMDPKKVEKSVMAHLERCARIEMGKHTLTHMDDPEKGQLN